MNVKKHNIGDYLTDRPLREYVWHL